MTTQRLEAEAVRTTVRARYGQIAQLGGGCCGTPGGCGVSNGLSTEVHDPVRIARGLGYSPEQTGAVPEGSNLGLGCGNPQAIAALKPGETVLDLGCGAGFDVFLAARAVGPEGRVIGVDMTPEMLTQARKNLAKSGFKHVEFRLGEIENLPVADATIDVVISNCVINLSPDKPRVFREAFRVLKPGGRLAVSDMVALAPLPAELQQEWELFTGCVAGASPAEHLRVLLEQAGFTEIRIVPRTDSHEMLSGWLPGRSLDQYVTSASVEAVKPATHA